MAGTKSITGVWTVQTEGAPYRYHMFAFSGDGLMLQANPHEGNQVTSDTMGMGLWEKRGKSIKARFVEYRLDRQSGETTKGVIDFDIALSADANALGGTCEFNIYGPDDNKHLKGPLQATLVGQRVKLNT